MEQLAEAQQALSLEVLRYDEQVEVEILVPLNKLIKEDFTNIAKLKKQLKQASSIILHSQHQEYNAGYILSRILAIKNMIVTIHTIWY